MFLITCAVVYLTVKQGLSAVSAADRTLKETAAAAGTPRETSSSGGDEISTHSGGQGSSSLKAKSQGKEESGGGGQSAEEEVPAPEPSPVHGTILKITLSYWQVMTLNPKLAPLDPNP
jgi:hypothetical protein